jgi:hypothetical protein
MREEMIFLFFFREDEHDASEDDERVSFSTNAQAQERAIIRDRFLAVEHG